MKCHIMFFGQDEEGDWVAKLECRHNPPFVNRSWVLTAEGREQFIGFELDCRKCDEGVRRDW